MLGKAFVVERGETQLGGGARAHLLHVEGCEHATNTQHASYANNVAGAMAEVKKNLYSSVTPCPHCCVRGGLQRVG